MQVTANRVTSDWFMVYGNMIIALKMFCLRINSQYLCFCGTGYTMATNQVKSQLCLEV